MKTKVKLVVAFAIFAMLGNINAEETTQNTNTKPTTQKSNGGGGSNKEWNDPYKVGIKKPKTGGFVGGEFGFGSAYSYADVYFYQNNGSYNNLWGGSDHTAIPINVFGGYQWYFYDRPWFHFGVRVRGHIGYSNYNTDITPYYNYWYLNNNASANLEISSHAIQYGVEAQFLWDFLNMG